MSSEKDPVGRPAHNRKLALAGIALTQARNNRHGIEALKQVRNEMEKVMIDSGYLEGAPFVWVTLAIRYGLKFDDQPHYQRINRKYGDLPLAIEVDTHALLNASVTTVTKIFRRAALIALIHAGHKYKRPVARLEAELRAVT